MSKYLNPFTDFGFKKLFGENSSRGSLISFLNAVLESDKVQITSIEYLPSQQLGDSSTDRASFFDLYCKDSRGRYFIVEIQRQSHVNFKERLLYYATQPIRRQAKKGIWAFELTPVYVIAILDFVLDQNTPGNEVSFVKLLNLRTGSIFYDKLTFIYIEIPKFRKSSSHIDSLLDQWLFLFKSLTGLSRIPKKLNDPAIMKFLEDAELAKLSEEEQYRYERSLKVYRDNLLIEKTHKIRLQEGYDKGHENGLQQGLQKGLQQGLQQGLMRGKEEGLLIGKTEGEYQKSIQIAETMLRKSMSPEIVAEVTGLELQTVNDLRLGTVK